MITTITPGSSISGTDIKHNGSTHAAPRIERFRIVASALGEFVLFQRRDDSSLFTSWIDDLDEPLDPSGDSSSNGWQQALAENLVAYFDGDSIDFRDVKTPVGPTFFHRCWDACRSIPRGRTVSYGELAEMAGGRSTAARAAGQAMRRNPLPVIVPCHRVLASNGKLHGFAGSTDPTSGALSRKRQLLELEAPSRQRN